MRNRKRVEAAVATKLLLSRFRTVRRILHLKHNRSLECADYAKSGYKEDIRRTIIAMKSSRTGAIATKIVHSILAIWGLLISRNVRRTWMFSDAYSAETLLEDLWVARNARGTFVNCALDKLYSTKRADQPFAQSATAPMHNSFLSQKIFRTFWIIRLNSLARIEMSDAIAPSCMRT